MNFVGVSDTAFLNDSNFNLVNMFGSFDTVHDFNNSNGNTINFNAGANFDALSAGSASGDTVSFLSGAAGDVVDLLGLTNDTVTLTGTASDDFLIFTAGCGTAPKTITASNLGSAGSPITIC